MQDVELLLNEALLGCLPMQFVHHEFVVVDFACDELQSLVVNIVEFNVLWLVGHEAAQVVLDGAQMQGQQMEVSVGEGERDVGVCGKAAVLHN